MPTYTLPEKENTRNMHMLSGAAALKNFRIRGYRSCAQENTDLF